MKLKAINQTVTTLFAFIVLVSILFFLGSHAYGKEWTVAQKEIWQIEKSLWEHWKKGEVDAFRNLFHDDCVIWGSRATTPRDKNLLYHIYSWIESYELEPYEVKVFGNVAIVQYRSDHRSPSMNIKSRHTSILKKQNGKWKIIGWMNADCEKLPPCP